MEVTNNLLRQIIEEEISKLKENKWWDNFVRNYYMDLNIKDPTDDQKVIKKSYRKKAIETHPDKGGDEEKFKIVSNAYSTLSNPEEKKKYDKKLYQDTEVCKKNSPETDKFCTANGMRLDNKGMKRLADLAGVQQSTQKMDPLNFAEIKLKLINKLQERAMERAKEGKFDQAQNFIDAMSDVNKAKTFEEIKGMYNALFGKRS